MNGFFCTNFTGFQNAVIKFLLGECFLPKIFPCEIITGISGSKFFHFTKKLSDIGNAVMIRRIQKLFETLVFFFGKRPEQLYKRVFG